MYDLGVLAGKDREGAFFLYFYGLGLQHSCEIWGPRKGGRIGEGWGAKKNN